MADKYEDRATIYEAERLRKRISAYPSKRRLARESGVMTRTIYQILNGSDPKLGTVEKIDRVLQEAGE